MRAQIGDRISVESQSADRHRRDGEIVGVHHSDGTPPYDVRWQGSDHATLVFPGPDAHIRHLGRDAGEGPEPL